MKARLIAPLALSFLALATEGKPDEEGFWELVEPLIENYCMDCFHIWWVHRYYVKEGPYCFWKVLEDVFANSGTRCIPWGSMPQQKFLVNALTQEQLFGSISNLLVT